jgi:hypothetical protein
MRPRVRSIGGLTMRTTKEKTGSIDRRHLLKGASLALGAAAATTAATVKDAAAGEAPRAGDHAGYRETDAVRTYYRLARL